MIIYRYIREFWSRTEARSKMIAEMPDNIIPMNYHLYEMRIDDNSLEMGIDYIWNIFGIYLEYLIREITHNAIEFIIFCWYICSGR